jgi:hypothetical protein
MAEGLPLASAMMWFDDPRTPVRRMRVAWHPEAGVVVLSLWAADQCTATFRLPVDRAADLIHLLVDAVADGPSPPQLAPTSVSVRERLRRVLRSLSRRNPIAPVVPLRRSE